MNPVELLALVFGGGVVSGCALISSADLVQRFRDRLATRQEVRQIWESVR